MRIRTMTEVPHSAVRVSYNGENFEEQLFCGDSWCDGSCGLPALVLQHPGVGDYGPAELKCFSDMVAVGRVWQAFRCKTGWTGAKVFVPESAGNPIELAKMMWW